MKHCGAATTVGGSFLQSGPLVRPRRAEAESRSGHAGVRGEWPRQRPCVGDALGMLALCGQGVGRPPAPRRRVWAPAPQVCVRVCGQPPAWARSGGRRENPCRSLLSPPHRPPEGTEAMGGHGAQHTCQALWGWGDVCLLLGPGARGGASRAPDALRCPGHWHRGRVRSDAEAGSGEGGRVFPAQGTARAKAQRQEEALWVSSASPAGAEPREGARLGGARLRGVAVVSKAEGEPRGFSQRNARL